MKNKRSNNKSFLLFFPMDAFARGSLELEGFLYIALGILGALLLYRFWMVILGIPVCLVFLLGLLIGKNISEGILLFSGVGSTVTLALTMSFLPKDYADLEWYYIAPIALIASTTLWYLVALLLQFFVDASNNKEI